MENVTTTPTITPRDKNSTITLVLIGVVIILCLGFIVVVIGYIGLTTGTNKVNTTDTTVTDSTPNSLVATQPAITLSEPTEMQIVNGQIDVKGTATYQFNNIRVELFDETNAKLASSTVSLTSVSDSVNNWQTQLDVLMSPNTTKGKLIVSSVEPATEVSVDIKFESYSESENLVLFTPLKNQIMFSNDLAIRGQAKGLFEGLLQIRLKDSNGNIIYSDSITIPDQLLSFTDFSYDISMDDLSSAQGLTGTWEFYYSSAKDGSEVILQTIPIRFL